MVVDKKYRIAGRFYNTVFRIIDWERKKKKRDESHEDWSEVMNYIAHRYYSIEDGHEKDDQNFCWDTIHVFKDIVHYVLEDYDHFSPDTRPEWFDEVEALDIYMRPYSSTNHVPASELKTT